MNKSQGSVPVEGSLFQMEKSNKNSTTNSQFFPDQSELVFLKDSKDRNSLAKSILFSCQHCSGPLVPIAECQVCKKPSIRQCVKCSLEIFSGKHDVCKNLIIYAKFSTKRFQHRNEEVR